MVFLGRAVHSKPGVVNYSPWTAWFCKWSSIGTQPRSFVDVLSVACTTRVKWLHQTWWPAIPGPFQKRIAYAVLAHHSTVLVPFPSPFIRDTCSISETHLFTSFIIAYDTSFSYFTEGSARIHFKVGEYKPSPRVYSQPVILCLSTLSFELNSRNSFCYVLTSSTWTFHCLGALFLATLHSTQLFEMAMWKIRN